MSIRRISTKLTESVVNSPLFSFNYQSHGCHKISDTLHEPLRILCLFRNTITVYLSNKNSVDVRCESIVMTFIYNLTSAVSNYSNCTRNLNSLGNGQIRVQGREHRDRHNLSSIRTLNQGSEGTISRRGIFTVTSRDHPLSSHPPSLLDPTNGGIEKRKSSLTQRTLRGRGRSVEQEGTGVEGGTLRQSKVEDAVYVGLEIIGVEKETNRLRPLLSRRSTFKNQRRRRL